MQVATDAAAAWVAATPAVTKDFQHDAEVHAKFWAKGYELLAALPDKPKRNPEQARAAETILNAGRASREAFMQRHAEPLYATLTARLTRFVRAEPLAYAAADLVPGLVPTRAQVAAESQKTQSAKDGIEVDQGIFFANIMACPVTG